MLFNKLNADYAIEGSTNDSVDSCSFNSIEDLTHFLSKSEETNLSSKISLASIQLFSFLIYSNLVSNIATTVELVIEPSLVSLRFKYSSISQGQYIYNLLAHLSTNSFYIVGVSNGREDIRISVKVSTND